MLPSARWRMTPGLAALALGIAIGRPGFKIIEPDVLEDGGTIESVCAVVLLVSLFCVGLRLQVPLDWHRWRVPLRLAALTMPVTILLAAGAAKVMFNVSFLSALLLGGILAPTDAVLSTQLSETNEAPDEAKSAFALAAEGALSSGLAPAAVVLVLGLMGLDDRSTGSVSLVVGAAWATFGAAIAGWLIGAGLARWIALLDFDRQTQSLEVLVVFATAALAYGAAEAIHTSGFLAVLAAGLALSRGGGLQSTRRRRALAPQVLQIASRVERVTALSVIVLLGAMGSEMDFRVSALLFALLLLALVRPLAVRLGLNIPAIATTQRRSLEWAGVRGAASLYCLVFAINHGLSAPLARQLAGITLLVMAGSIVVHAVTVTPVHKPSAGAVSNG